METSAHAVLESILARTIDKQDALKSFDKLSKQERSRVLAGLKSRLNGEGQDAGRQASGHAPAEVPAPGLAAPALRSIHETDLSDAQKQVIDSLSKEFARRVPKSRHNALVHQAYFVDQRKVAGLKRALKSMQFQLTYDRAEGPYLVDVDGNRYVDITGDNGVNFFGHQPEFIKNALIKRLNQGYPLVAYSEDLFEAARLFCEITGHERMVFAQTGTEAVMWAVRIARAATGRKKVLIFDGSYHGLSDTVLAMKGRNGASMSAGLGLLQEFADQLVILDYGNMADLEMIEKNAGEIACVLVEPIQSRFPARQPVEYIRELRKLTLEKDIVLIFDEMITGFRAGRKGAEGFYQVKPDMATYGKVPGGGMPTGMIAGMARYMDFVDGGTWGFDDASMPSLKRAVIAGTHTQNSLKVSATLAACTEMKRMCQATDCDYLSCDCAIGQLNRKTRAMCEELNGYFLEKRVPLTLEYFSSLFRIFVTDDPYGFVRELLIILLKVNGVETSTSGNCFMNLAHGDADVRSIVEAFRKSVDTLVEHGFFAAAEAEAEAVADAAKEGKPTPAAKAAEPAGAKASGATSDASSASAASAADGARAQLDKLRELLLADLLSINNKGN